MRPDEIKQGGFYEGADGTLRAVDVSGNRVVWFPASRKMNWDEDGNLFMDLGFSNDDHETSIEEFAAWAVREVTDGERDER